MVGVQNVENESTAVVCKWWNNLKIHYPHIKTDEFIIIPNHVHGIIIIRDFIPVGAGSSRPDVTGSSRPDVTRLSIGRDDRAPTLGNMVAYFKYQTTKQINPYNNGIRKIRQRNFYDHTIRDDKSLYFVRQYIRNNPVAWEKDAENHLENEIALIYPEDPDQRLKIKSSSIFCH